MKKLILILALVLFFPVFQAHSQTWAPDGAEWYYDYENFWYTGYVHVTIVGDTVINDTACRILNRFSVTYNQEWDTITTYDHGNAYMYGDEDKVYLYENDKFYVLYDFSASPGDTLIIPNNSILGGLGCDPEGEIIVTDTTTTFINGQKLRKIQVHWPEGSHWAIYGDIIETIGPVHHYMLPEPTYYCVVDLYEGGPLRCYSDPEFGLYNTGMAPECDYLVSVPELSDSHIKIFPNPNSGTLYVNISNRHNYSYSIINISGIEVKNGLLLPAENKLDLSSFAPGIYTLVLKGEEDIITEKIVIK